MGQTQVIPTRLGGLYRHGAVMHGPGTCTHTICSHQSTHPVSHAQTPNANLVSHASAFFPKPWSRTPWCASSACPPSKPKSMTATMMSTFPDVSVSCAHTASALATLHNRIHTLMPITNKTKQTFCGPWSIIDVNILMV